MSNKGVYRVPVLFIEASISHLCWFNASMPPHYGDTNPNQLGQEKYRPATIRDHLSSIWE